MARLLVLLILLAAVVFMARWLMAVVAHSRQLSETSESGRRFAERERIAQNAPGGMPANPIPVVSPVLVEPMAADIPCVRCDGAVEVENHEAVVESGAHLRVAPVTCRVCGFKREIYFAIRAVPEEILN